MPRTDPIFPPDFVFGQIPTVARLNDVIDELKNWYAHRNAGGYNLSNLGALTFTGGAAFSSASNKMGVNDAAPGSFLSVAGVDDNMNAAVASGLGGHFQLSSGAGAATDNKLMAGVVAGTDHTDSYAYIQAIKPGNAVRRLLLNPVVPPLPGFGSVGIATPTPYSQLSFGQLMVAGGGSKPRFALYEEPDGEYFRGIGLCDLGSGIFSVGIFSRAIAPVPTDLEATLYVTDQGRVGIGRYNAQDMLDVHGAVTVRGISVGPQGPLGFLDYTAGTTRIVARGPDASTGGAFLVLGTRSDGASVVNLLAIASNGQITASIPSSNSGAGGGFWYDPSDGNRVKYTP